MSVLTVGSMRRSSKAKREQNKGHAPPRYHTYM